MIHEGLKETLEADLRNTRAVAPQGGYALCFDLLNAFKRGLNYLQKP